MNCLSEQASQPRVICVTSGKGGVGKTNFCANLAYCLTLAGKRVLILDADLNLANIDVLLGLTPRYNLHHVLTGEKGLTEILVKGPGGMNILPASSGIMEMASLTESQKLYFLAEMEPLADNIDFLLIDTGAGINENVIYFNLAAQERIILLTPEPTSMTDAYATIKVLSSRHDVKRFRILVNLAESEKEALAVFRKLSIVADRFLETISLDFLGFLPNDFNLPKSVRKQQLVVQAFPDSIISKKLRQLAKEICREKISRKVDGNIKFFWKGMLEL
jgi:flagellar biosynthesis protein FlhG